jgi:hypothetical protein
MRTILDGLQGIAAGSPRYADESGDEDENLVFLERKVVVTP